MKYMNFKTVAFMLSAATVLALTGCGSEGTPSNTQLVGSIPGIIPPVIPPPTPENPCPIPEEAKQPITLDQNKTKDALTVASATLELGIMLVGNPMFNTKTTKSTDEPTVSKLTSTITDKVKALKESTTSLKKTLASELPEEGENIACESGTYSLEITDASEEIEGGSKDMNKIMLSFNECILTQSEETDSLIGFFNDVLLYTSTFGRVIMNIEDPVLQVYTYNGSMSFEFNNESTDTGSIPADSGTDISERTNKWGMHLISNALSIKFEEDGVLAGGYTSTEDMLFTMEDNSSEEHNDFDSYNSEYSWSLTWDGNETMKMFGESNVTFNLTAICFAADGTGSNNSTSSPMGNTENRDNTTNSNGYIALHLQEGAEQMFIDSFSDELVATYTYTSESMYPYSARVYNPESTRSSETTLDGTVGSMLIGGSVAIDTQDPWLMSSDYDCDRTCMETTNLGMGSGFYFDRTPYDGKTVLTGTNSAVVEFHYDEEDVTYGTIQVDDGEVVEYDSIYDMIDGNIPI